MSRDWRDDRIAELEAELAAKVELEKTLAEQAARIAEQAARIAEQAARIAELEALVAELSERLGQDSRNSHRPPSTDSPQSRKKRKSRGGEGKDGKGKSPRKRGAQPGHRGAHRQLVPEDQVSKFVDLFPSHCDQCAERLPRVMDPSPLRHQLTEVPPVVPETVEWRRHACTCGQCGHVTRAAYDDDLIPASPFGPRLMAIMGMLTGIYHLSRRRTVSLLSELVGVRVSLGALSAVEARVSEAVAPAVDEAWTRVQGADVKHTDGTGWLQAGQTLALWTLATTAATVFKIVVAGTKETLRPLYGQLRGILVSDRDSSLGFWAMEKRQVCWAHLLRQFVSFSERDGPAGALGRELLDYAGLVFEYWRDYRAGKLTREQFVAWMAPVQAQVEAALRRGVAMGVKRLSGSCANVLDHQPALWTFVKRDDVDPTNNHAEREIRAFVLWRKRSFGTQSERGNLFAERMMTIAHTARKQERNALEFLTECCEAARDGDETPSLFAAAG